MTPWAPRLTQQLSSLLEPLPPLVGSFPGGRRGSGLLCSGVGGVLVAAHVITEQAWVTLRGAAGFLRKAGRAANRPALWSLLSG